MSRRKLLENPNFILESLENKGIFNVYHQITLIIWHFLKNFNSSLWCQGVLLLDMMIPKMITTKDLLLKLLHQKYSSYSLCLTMRAWLLCRSSRRWISGALLKRDGCIYAPSLYTHSKKF